MQPRPPEREVEGIFGATGQGKTQCLKARMRSLRARRVTNRSRLGILAYDPMEQFEGLNPDGTNEYTADVEHVAYSREDLLGYLEGIGPDESFSVAYVPPVGANEPAELNFLAGVAWALGNVYLVIDEAHACCNHRAFDSGEIPNMVACVKRGRHRKVSLIIAAQRPVDVATLVRAETLAGTTYYFRIVRHDDLRDVASERGPDFARRVAELPRLTCIKATFDSAEYLNVHFDAYGVPYLTRSASHGEIHAEGFKKRGVSTG